MAENTSSNIRVIELAQIDTDYPIQSKNRRFVNYGNTNQYPEFLLDLYLYSPTNNAVIAATSQMIAGGGIEVSDETASPLAATELAALLTTEKIVKTAFNLKTYGYAVWKVTTTDKIINVEPQDSGDWRSGIKDENDNVHEWWYSDDWSSSTGKHKPEPIPVFKQFTTDTTEVLILHIPMLGFDYYPPVDYTGGVASIQLEGEICEFHLSAIQNGLNPGSVLNFNNGVPPDEEQDAIELKVKRKFAGSSKAGKFLLSFNDNKDNATTVESLAITDIDKQYVFLSKETTSKILISHRVTTPLLFGIRGDGGGLGNNADELKDSYILYYDTVVQPYQQIIEVGIKEILFKNNVQSDINWIEYMPFKREKEPEEAETTTLNEQETGKWVTKLEVAKQLPKELVEFSEKPMNGEAPTENSMMKKLFKFNVIDKKHRNVLFKALENHTKDGYLFEYEDIKDFPKIKGCYFSEVSMKKMNKDGN